MSLQSRQWDPGGPNKGDYLCSAQLDSVPPKEDKPILGCYVHLQLPDGTSERIWADFDTRCDADVIDSALAWRLKESHKIPWGATGGC